MACFWNRPFAQIPQSTSPIYHNAPFCNRNVHTAIYISVTTWCIMDISLMYCEIWEMGHKDMWSESPLFFVIFQRPSVAAKPGSMWKLSTATSRRVYLAYTPGIHFSNSHANWLFSKSTTGYLLYTYTNVSIHCAPCKSHWHIHKMHSGDIKKALI